MNEIEINMGCVPISIPSDSLWCQHNPNIMKNNHYWSQDLYHSASQCSKNYHPGHVNYCSNSRRRELQSVILEDGTILDTMYISDIPSVRSHWEFTYTAPVRTATLKRTMNIEEKLEEWNLKRIDFDESYVEGNHITLVNAYTEFISLLKMDAVVQRIVSAFILSQIET